MSNFPMNPYGRLLVGESVYNNLKNEREEVILPCSHQSTCIIQARLKFSSFHLFELLKPSFY